MKDQSEIRKELQRLMLAELEARIVFRYYTDLMTRMLTESIEKSQRLTKSAQVESLSNEESEQLIFKLRKAELEGQACQEAAMIIRRLAENRFSACLS